MGIFDKRNNYKPFEYPQVQPLIDVINQTYWKVSEVDFTGDVQDFKSRLNPIEQEVLRRSLLSIAQVEVDVKLFWGKLYDYFPKPEFNNLGMTFGENECYDKETQVLTNHGFKYFKDLTTDDKVAQYNMDTFEVDFVKPLDYIIKPFKGKLHHYSSRQSDLMVTPNHDILVKLNNTKSPWSRWRKVKSSQGIWGKNFSMPVAGFKQGGKKFNFLDRLLIALQADGSLMGTCPSNKNTQNFYFTFTLKKDRKIQRLKWILEELNLPYLEVKKPNGQTKISGSLKGRVEFDIISKVKTFSYINIEEIDAEWGEQFIEELSNWDCHKPTQENRNHITYYNTNVPAIDKIVEICAISGFRTCKHISKPIGYRPDHMCPGSHKPIKTKDFYSLNITKNNKTTYPYVKEVEYDDMVYCVTVPSGNIITRRNQHVAVSGNCTHSEAYSKLLEVLNYEDDFKKLLEIPVFKKKLELIEEAMTSKTDIIEKLLFFTIVIENSSLFSQFANILSFSRFKGLMKNVANIINWTASDENCLSINALILTPSGFKNLRGIKENDLVFGYLPKTGELLSCPVQKKIHRSNPDKKMVRFQHKNDTNNVIDCTLEHNMLVYDNNGSHQHIKAIDLYNHISEYKNHYFKEYPTFELVSLEDFNIQIIEVSDDYEVGCVQVKTGNIIVKQNNQSNPFITGNCHANAGILLINLINQEYPERIEKLKKGLKKSILKYIQYEQELLDWIFEKGELEFYTKNDLLNFMKYRIDDALVKMNFEPIFNVSKMDFDKMAWFYEETNIQTLPDFFAIRPVEYSKHNQPFNEDTLF